MTECFVCGERIVPGRWYMSTGDEDVCGDCLFLPDNFDVSDPQADQAVISKAQERYAYITRLTHGEWLRLTRNPA